MKIIEAKFEDIPELSSLLNLLFSQETDFQPDQEKQAEGLRQIINRPEAGRILIFRDNNRILGMVNILFTISTAMGGRVALLEDMVVHPDARRFGVGSLLLRGAIDFAKSNGCSRITLLTDQTNSPAIRFYEQHGFELSKMVLLRLFFQ